jgi:hypothetical protein
MRKANDRPLESGIYARLRDVQMSEADRQDAVKALHQAEQIAEVFLWMKEKVVDLGHSFLKPSLKH